MKLLTCFTWLTLALMALTNLPATSHAEESTDYQNRVSFKAEYGFIAFLNHRIQFSEDNTYFDYVDDGGQDSLFEHKRFTGEFLTPDRDRVVFVYQPIEVITEKPLARTLRVDNQEFVPGTPMRFRYSFPYYRATYLWSTYTNDSLHLWLGGGMQIRNAAIEFRSLTGGQQVTNRNIGPVPLFAMRLHYQLHSAVELQFEAEGNYANTKVINGDADNSVTGAIFDSALSLAFESQDFPTIVGSVRYLTGGAQGQNDDPYNPSGDGYSSNWIDVLAVSLGANFRSF